MLVEIREILLQINSNLSKQLKGIWWVLLLTYRSIRSPLLQVEMW